MRFYRYRTSITSHYDSGFDKYTLCSPTVELSEFKLMKETPKGYWIGYSWDTEPYKWVSKTSRKRFAYPTKEEALKSFIIRTQRSIQIMKERQYTAELALSVAQKMQEQLCRPITRETSQPATSHTG